MEGVVGGTEKEGGERKKERERGTRERVSSVQWFAATACHLSSSHSTPLFSPLSSLPSLLSPLSSLLHTLKKEFVEFVHCQSPSLIVHLRKYNKGKVTSPEEEKKKRESHEIKKEDREEGEGSEDG